MSPVTRDRRRALVRLALFALAIAAGFAAVTLAGFGPDDARAGSTARAPPGPLVFVLVAGALGLVLFPGHVTAAAAGVLFGTLAGTGLMLAAALLGSTAGAAGRPPPRRGRAVLAARPARPAPSGVGERERLRRRARLPAGARASRPASSTTWPACPASARGPSSPRSRSARCRRRSPTSRSAERSRTRVSTRGAIAVALYAAAAVGGALAGAPPGPRARGARAGLNSRRCCAPLSVLSAALAREASYRETDSYGREPRTPRPVRASVIVSRPVAAPCTGGCPLTCAMPGSADIPPRMCQLDRAMVFEKA